MTSTFVRASGSTRSTWVVIAVATILAMFVGMLVSILDSVLVVILFLPVIPIIWILTDYRVGVVFLTFILPFADSYYLPKFSGFNLVGYLALATLLAFGLRHFGGTRIVIRPPSWLIMLYVLPILAATGIGVFHLQEIPNYLVVTEAFAQDTPIRYIKSYFIYPMLTLLWMLLFANAMRTSERPQRYVWLLCSAAALPAIAVLVGVAVLGVQGISVDELSGGTFSNRRLLSVTGFHSNEIGILLSSVFGPLLFVAGAANSLRERLIVWPILGVVTLALLLTFTRGAYVSAGVIVLFFLLGARGSTLAKSVIVVAIIGIIAAMGGAVGSRIAEGWSGAASSDVRATAVTSSRTNIWRALQNDVEAHPVIGNGLRSTAWSSAAKSQVFPTHPHNQYLEILLDMGIIGLTLLLMFYWRFAKLLRFASEATPKGLPLVTAYLNGAYAALIGFLISSIANGHYTPVPENTFFWASFGVALAYWNGGNGAALPKLSTKPAGSQRRSLNPRFRDARSSLYTPRHVGRSELANE